MIEDELIKIWQSSSNQERVKFEKSKLMIELDSSLGRLHRWWKYLEVVEIISQAIAILAFAFIVYWAPFTSTKIAAILVVIWSIYAVFRILGLKKFKPSDLEENYLSYLKRSREYLKAQKKLLATSLYWYILPIYPILFLFVMDFWEIATKRFIIVLVFLLMIGMTVYTYYLQKRRITKEIEPRITKVDALIKELE